MQSHSISFTITDQCPIAKVLGYECFWSEDLTTSIFHSVQHFTQVGFTIQIDQSSISRWSIQLRMMNNGASSASIFKIVEQKSHSGGPHLVFRHLVIKDRFVKFFSPVKIFYRYFKPVDGVCIE